MREGCAIGANSSSFHAGIRFLVGGIRLVNLRFVCASVVALLLSCILLPCAAWAQPTVDEPPLPPVVVEGEAEEDDLPTVDDSDTPTDPLEGVVVEGQAGDDFSDTPPLFPSPSDFMINQLDGGSRGNPYQSLFDSSRAIDIVTRQQIDESAAIDLGQALETTPGVMIQRTGRGQSSPFVRGLTGNQVLILVDGIRMTNSHSGRDRTNTSTLSIPTWLNGSKSFVGPAACSTAVTRSVA